MWIPDRLSFTSRIPVSSITFNSGFNNLEFGNNPPLQHPLDRHGYWDRRGVLQTVQQMLQLSTSQVATPARSTRSDSLSWLSALSSFFATDIPLQARPQRRLVPCFFILDVPTELSVLLALVQDLAFLSPEALEVVLQALVF